MSPAIRLVDRSGFIDAIASMAFSLPALSHRVQSSSVVAPSE
mgnify:CR=1 FL=1